MANQTPQHPGQPAPAHPAPVHPASAQHKGEQHKGEQKAGQRADPANAQYMISITPEQYESQLKQAETQAAAKDAPPRAQIEMGGSGIAKVSFKDAAGGDVKIDSAEWSSTGPVTVTADDKDPMSAKLVPTGLGPATVTATANAAGGSAQAHTDLMVIQSAGTAVGGTIEISVVAPKDKSAAQSSAQGSQIMPVPPPAPPKSGPSTVPPAQTMSQPSPQPQPQPQPPPGTRPA